jgi:hypothetical protein
MLAGGMVIAAPSMVPEAAAAGSLYVSAENAIFENTFGGAQIVEVVVLDPNRSRTDVSQGEPVVKVYENQLRMAQGVDGNWYGYFGDKTKVPDADSFENNLDFGEDDNPTLNKGDFNEASNVFQANSANSANGVITNFPTLSTWNASATSAGVSNADQGQIGVSTTADWPFIQLYDLTIETFDVVYEQAGADEIVTLNYDSSGLDDYSGLELDRNEASQESQVHLTLTDNQLNIDPTAKDIVVFDVTTGSETVSFTNGTQPGPAAADNFTYKAWSNSFDDNGKLIINYDASSVGTDLFNNTATLDDLNANKQLVFYEGSENSGVFYNTDDNDQSNLVVKIDAKRGTTATFDYNDSAQSFVVANDFGVIDMDESSVGDEWNSGEEITVTLIDQDLNKNTSSSEDLLLVNTTSGHLVPALIIGNPLTVNVQDSSVSYSSKFSNITWYDNTSISSLGLTADLRIDTGYTGANINGIDTVNTYFNFDFTSFNTTAQTIKTVCLVNGTDTGRTASGTDGLDVACGSNFEYKGIVEIEYPASQTGKMYVNITTSDADYTALNTAPFVADVFSFGAGVNNAIYRLQLEETGDNTATFEGTVEYTMLNQLNINTDATYTTLDSISSSVNIIVEQDMTDEDSPRVNYNDLGADGVTTQIADQQEAPTHNGVVSFDSENYKIADTVVVTLIDQDMNTDTE